MKVMMIEPYSEPLGPQQSVGEVDQQPQGHEGGERIIEGHDQNSSKLIAGIAVADRQHEKSEPDDQHDDVHHLDTPGDAQTI